MWGLYPNDLVELDDNRRGFILRNRIGTTTFVIELLDEEGRRSGEYVTEDRNNFKKCNK
jgi:hypothetical protein